MKKFLPLSFLLACTAPAAPLTLGEALARVEAGHPWLQSREAVQALGAARAARATVRPVGEVALTAENTLGTGELSAARSLETTLQFSRALDWADQRAARRSAATAQNEADQAAWQERRRAVLAEAARRFVTVAAAQANLDATRELADLAGQTVADLEDRAARAVAAAPEVARAQLALGDARLAAEHAEHLLLAARQALAATWGEATPDFESVAADFSALPASAPFGQLAARLAAAPEQARYAAVGRWKLAQAALARSSGARGQPRWTAGLRRNEAADAFGLVFSLDYAWPERAAASSRSAEAAAEHDLNAAEAAAALLEARATLFSLCQELNHARIEHDAARDDMQPAAQHWLSAVESGLAAGRYGLRDLLEARAALFAARRRQIEAAAEYHLTLVAIEQLLGGNANP